MYLDSLPTRYLSSIAITAVAKEQKTFSNSKYKTQRALPLPRPYLYT